MNAIRQAAWLFCALIALAFSGWYFVSVKTITKLDAHTLANTADTVVTGLIVRQFDTTGMLFNYLSCIEMRHIPDQNTTILKHPHITLVQKNQPNWDIRSKYAQSIKGGEQITFIGSVTIHQDRSHDTSESTITTEKLFYFPEKKFATTPLPVMFQQPGTIVHTFGMNAYLANKRIQLLRNAHATYQPTLE
jgi:lipopolysaccharide export system protein LptC